MKRSMFPTLPTRPGSWTQMGALRFRADNMPSGEPSGDENSPDTPGVRELGLGRTRRRLSVGALSRSTAKPSNFFGTPVHRLASACQRGPPQPFDPCEGDVISDERTSDPVMVHESADVAQGAELGSGTSIWHLAQVGERARLGDDCVVGRGAYIGPGVRIGHRCKIQNYALVYAPASLADGVFIGPAVVLTNDTYPRAVNRDGSLKSGTDWEPVGVTIDHGASIGARAVCVAPVVIGAWAMVAAGAVVTSDVLSHALVAGVPARRIAWVGSDGQRLDEAGGGAWVSRSTGERFVERDGILHSVDAGGER